MIVTFVIQGKVLHFMNFRNAVLKSALAASVGLIAGAVHAQSIGVSFSGFVTSSESPGIVSGTNWTDLTSSSGSSIVLDNSSGSATTASLTYSSAGTDPGLTPTNTANTGTNALYHQAIYGGSSVAPTITVTSIPYASYLVYVYIGDGGGSSSTVSVTDGHTTYYLSSAGASESTATTLKETTSTNSSSPTIGTGQYAVFSESSPSFTIAADGSVDDVVSNHIFGFQIVNAGAAPEPASMALLLPLGIPAALGVFRRKKR